MEKPCNIVTGCPTCFFDAFCAHKYWKKQDLEHWRPKKWGAHPMKSPASGFLDIDELFLVAQSSWVGTESWSNCLRRRFANPATKFSFTKQRPHMASISFRPLHFHTSIHPPCLIIAFACLYIYIYICMLYNVLDFFREPETYSKIGFLQLFARFWFLADLNRLQPFSNIDFFQLLARIILLAAVFLLNILLST